MTNPLPFSFQFSLAGVDPAKGGAGNMPLPTGYYTGKIVDCYGRVASTGRHMIEFKIEIDRPEGGTLLRTTRVNIPTGPDDNSKHYLRAAVESIGYAASQIDQAGAITFSPETFKGRSCRVYYVEDPEGGNKDSLNMIDPITWEKGKAALASTQAAATSALGGAGAGGLGGGGLGGGGAAGGGLGAALQQAAGAPLQAAPTAGGLAQALGGGALPQQPAAGGGLGAALGGGGLGAALGGGLGAALGQPG